MRDDLRRWDERYRERVDAPLPAPEALLLRQAAQFTGGDALDVACGLGQNALWLAARGYRVSGVDGSVLALRRAAAESRVRGLPVRWLCADLDLFTPAPASLDLVVVVRFLDRMLVPRLMAALRPGGLLFHCTFNVNRLQDDGGFPRAYLLEPGELGRLLAPLQRVAADDGADTGAPVSWMLARRAGA